MAYGLYGNQATALPMVSGQSVTSYCKIMGANQVWIELPTFAAGMGTASLNVYIQGSRTAITSTFRRISVMGNYSGATGIYNWEIPAGVGGFMVQAPVNLTWNYIQLEFNGVATAAGYTPVVHIHQ
jgi:hypothetical protein